jgi:hypothetical protein
MATQPAVPPPDIIEPQSPPETPPLEHPEETPFQEPLEIPPDGPSPDIDEPGRGPDELPPPPD